MLTIDVEMVSSMMTSPDNNDSHQVKRCDAQYNNLSQKYMLHDAQAALQYYELYDARLETMQPKVQSSAEKLWPEVQIKSLCELQGCKERCIIIGTICKKQQLKPSILKEISEENHLMPQPVLHKYISDSDDISLEDKLQKIQLIGNIDVGKLVNGIICAVIGEQDIAGKFKVEDICFAGLPMSVPREITNTDEYLVVTSGLDLSSSSDRFNLEMLCDYVVGNLGSPSEQNSISKIARVIIAGNLIHTNTEASFQDKVTFLKEADEFIAQIASKCPIDVMPGEFDPCNYLMPQQPFHPCFFSKSSQYETMKSVSNPYECEVSGRIIMGTAGQNVADICKFSSFTDSIDVLKTICDWGHIAPTAPDTLVSYSFTDADPFIIDTRPDVIFIGNQDNFACSIIHEDTNPVLLVSVPRFSLEGVCVLINLKSLECKPLQFSTSSFEENLIEGEK